MNVTRPSVRRTGLSSAAPVRCLAGCKKEHRYGGDRRPDDPHWAVVGVKACDEHDRALDTEINSQGDKGATDEPHRPSLARLGNVGQFPEHNRRGTDLDQTVEAKASKRDRSRNDRRDCKHDDADDVPAERRVFEVPTPSQQPRSNSRQSPEIFRLSPWLWLDEIARSKSRRSLWRQQG